MSTGVAGQVTGIAKSDAQRTADGLRFGYLAVKSQDLGTSASVVGTASRYPNPDSRFPGVTA
jgi:hypothetical protein